MPQYLMSVHHGPDGPDLSPSEMQASWDATGVFNEEIKASGNWVFAGGLEPPTTATVVDATSDKAVVTDGPYLESKELLGGFWVVDAADHDEALALAERGSRACRSAVEVRPFHSA